MFEWHGRNVIAMKNIPPTVTSFISRFVEAPCVERIILFGSRAVGDNEDRADVDLAISAPTLSRIEFSTLRIAAFDARSLYWISLVHFEQTANRLRERIINQGVLIYERKETSG